MQKEEQTLCLEDHQVSIVKQDQGDRMRDQDKDRKAHTMLLFKLKVTIEWRQPSLN